MTAIKGRGAPANEVSSRFHLPAREVDGDWLDARLADEEDQPPPLRTTVTLEQARTIITRNNSPDIGFEQSVNAYRGCEHGCIYCFARPSHARFDLSPGLDFESRLFAKPDAARLLRQELARRAYVVKTIAMGTNTDPYQPIDARYCITRACIEVLADCRHPLMITTKSNRVLRDLDLLGPMAAQGLVAVAISLTTLDAGLHRKLEPRAPSPASRLAAIRGLSQAGVPAHASLSPMIPAINDHEIEALVAAAAEAGAQSVSFIPVRLPFEVAPLFRDWLDAHYPDRAAKVMSLIQSMRGGRDNDPNFGTRMRGSGAYAELIGTRFRVAQARHGLGKGRLALRHDLFVPPSDQGDLFSMLR
ncbi:PA0069 family radical SAM protein [Sphingobium sp. B11D3D]|uniref:PA0069 family radical SAM protein n=1 Tax=Sphingobium sp. B11D3D TaxID=2940576 RepID=UPI00222561EE|nr:PA0069 family radical SAM protein [Sphingobium sp. B11D3D]MCW2369633.1 DNA repair photolyase [Sphingobium sp. B11D3D]